MKTNMGFFKVFIPETSANRQKLPTAYTDYMDGKLLRNIFLRDRFGNLWPIGLTKLEKDIYFEYGWEKFIKDNIVELGDFLIFDYDGTRIFDFKLLGRNGCVKEGVGGLKIIVKEEEVEEMNVEHQNSLDPKENTRATDRKNISSFDVRNENTMVEEKGDDDKEYENIKEVPEEVDDNEEEEDDDEYKEEEVDEERTGIFKKTTPRSKAKCKIVTASKVNNSHDQFATDIFKSGRASKPKNPYFVTKIRPDRRNHLYVPADVVRDYKLLLPSRMTIRDTAGREFEAKLKIWKDGRVWLIGGWKSLCKWNLVEKKDTCICEFVREKHNDDFYLQVHIVHEGECSHPNKK